MGGDTTGRETDIEVDKPAIRLSLARGAKKPEFATAGAAAMDVAACLPPDTYITLAPGQRMSVPTGLAFEIPPGFLISVRPRSGLALKHGITLLNTPGTIDSDYRGELRIIMVNLGDSDFRIEHGDRIAQILVEKMQPFVWETVDSADFSPTERGHGGFGSTGLA